MTTNELIIKIFTIGLAFILFAVFLFIVNRELIKKELLAYINLFILFLGVLNLSDLIVSLMRWVLRAF